MAGDANGLGELEQAAGHEFQSRHRAEGRLLKPRRFGVGASRATAIAAARWRQRLISEELGGRLAAASAVAASPG